MFLLDTNVVSKLRRVRPNKAVLAWMKDLPPEDVFVSVVTIGEIQAGIEVTREQDLAKAVELDAWLDQIVRSHNVLAMNAAIFREWARLKHRKSDTLIEDAMIAATAIVHESTVATRNVRDFRMLGVRIENPFLGDRS